MDPDRVRQRLDEERVRLEGLRSELRVDESSAAEELSTYDQHPGDLGTETFEQEKDLSIVEQLDGELEDVERALRRVDDGSYGTCEACGKPIGDERLDAMPAARFCVEDQARAEREAGFSGGLR